jgi:predicted XRE-type DNA-binding protein
MPYGVDPIPELKRQLATARFRTADVAVRMGTDPARVSDLRHGKLDRFSLETLIRFAARLSWRVELTLANERARRPQ